ncbi:MAG: DUF4011 domain-containing protein [Firmicutes bacterium]|nr:DUF4011 domain-containing protein [Bacillota bacterium]
MGDRLKITIDSSSIFNYSMYCSKIAPIDGIYIKNLTSEIYEGITVEVSSTPEFFEPYSVSCNGIFAHSVVSFASPELVTDSTKLAYLSTDTNAFIHVGVYCAGELIDEAKKNIELISFDAWGGCQNHPELLAALVTPAQHEIREVLSNVGTKNSVLGYKGKSAVDIELELEQLYEAVRELRITYSITPFSTDKVGERLKLPEAVIHDKSANSLEISLLYASCLEAMGFNPLLIIFGGKAIVGCYLTDKIFYGPVIDSFKTLTELCANGNVCLFEPSSVVNGTNISFDNSRKMALAVFEHHENFIIAIDIKRARKEHILPLPSRIYSDEGLSFERGKSPFDALEVKDSFEDAEVDVYSEKTKEYRGRLLDMSSDNPLLNINEHNSLLIGRENYGRLLEIAESNSSLIILDKREDYSDVDIGGAIVTELDKKALNNRLGYFKSKLNRKYGSGSGGNIYITFGTARLRTGEPDSENECPLILLPCRLTKDQSGLHRISFESDSPVFNLTLFEKIQNIYGINLFALGEIGDLQRSVDMLRDAVSMTDTIVLSFEKMYLGFFEADAYEKAMRISPETLRSNALSDSICRGEYKGTYSFDSSKAFKYETNSPYPLTHEQVRAVACADSCNYSIIDGAAGSGRTTVAAYLASAAARSRKNILYVAADRRLCDGFRRKLDKIGLGDTVLYLNKARSNKFSIKQEFNFCSEQDDLFAALDGYQKASRAACEYYKVLNKKRAFGFSLADAIHSYEKYSYSEKSIDFNRERVLSLDRNKLAEWFSLISEMAIVGSEAGEVHNNPLSFVRCKELSYEKKDMALTMLKSYASATRDLISTQNEIIKLFYPDSTVKTLAETKALIELLELIGNDNEIPFCYFDNDDIVASIPKLRTVIEYGKSCHKMRAELTETFSDEIFSIPAHEYILECRESKLTFKGRAVQKRVYQSLCSYCRKGKSISRGDMSDILRAVEKYREYTNYVKDNSALIERYFGVDITAPDRDTPEIWDNFEAVERDCERYCELLRIILHNEAVDKNNIVSILMQKNSDTHRYKDELYKIKKAFVSYEETERDFVAAVSLDIYSQKEYHRSDWFEYLPASQTDMLHGFDGLKQWVNWLNVRDKAIAAGFDSAVNMFESGEINSANIRPAFLKGLFRTMCEALIESEPVLSDFGKEKYLELCSKAREYYDKKNEILISNIKDIVSSSMQKQSAALADLDGTSVTVDAVRDNLPELKEYYSVFVSLKDSVLDYVSKDDITFDYIVFDDADQIESEQAIPLFALGRKLVFLGNSAYCSRFTGACIDWENRYFEGFDKTSIMSELLEIGLPTERLTKYRGSNMCSAAFLNRYFKACGFDEPYGVYPMAKTTDGVKLTRVNGSFDVERTRTNLVEAAAVVDEIARIASLGEGKSICVYAMNSSQKHLIEALVIKRVSLDASLRDQLFVNTSEPLIIRDISNMPTEPRDIILISMTYALPEKTRYYDKMTGELRTLLKGNSFMSFASLMSMSRECVHAFVSFGVSTLLGASCFSDGYRYMKKFVLELYNGADLLSEVCNAKTRNPIAEKIADCLKEKGYNCVIGYGFGKLFADVAVENPDKPGEYILAVVLDSSAGCAGMSFYDREIEYADKLAGQPWKVVRIFETEWFVSPERQLEAVYSALKPTVHLPEEE